MSISIRDIGVDHYVALTTAVANPMRTRIAEHTLAEVNHSISIEKTRYGHIPKRNDITYAQRKFVPGHWKWHNDSLHTPNLSPYAQGPCSCP